MSDAGRSNWLLAAILLSLWPLYQGLTVTMASFDRRVPSSEVEAQKMLLQQDGDSISYSFERIWGYYRRLSLATLGLWWFGLIRMFYLSQKLYRGHSSIFSSIASGRVVDVFQKGVALATGDKLVGTYEWHLSLHVGAIIFSSAAIWAIERLSIRSVPPPPPQVLTKDAVRQRGGAAPKQQPTATAGPQFHPLTGEVRSQLDVECQRAITAAPAGIPGAEVGWGVLLSTFIGGPGFALLLWWSRGEEEAGWKSRRAFRAAVAAAGKKQ